MHVGQALAQVADPRRADGRSTPGGVARLFDGVVRGVARPLDGILGRVHRVARGFLRVADALGGRAARTRAG